MTDERLLIRRAQRGDVDALRELVERAQVNVYRLAARNFSEVKKMLLIR